MDLNSAVPAQLKRLGSSELSKRKKKGDIEKDGQRERG